MWPAMNSSGGRSPRLWCLQTKHQRLRLPYGCPAAAPAACWNIDALRVFCSKLRNPASSAPFLGVVVYKNWTVVKMEHMLQVQQISALLKTVWVVVGPLTLPGEKQQTRKNTFFQCVLTRAKDHVFLVLEFCLVMSNTCARSSGPSTSSTCKCWLEFLPRDRWLNLRKPTSMVDNCQTIEKHNG